MRIVVRRSALDYTWLSMVAEIGGYVGLLLGISLVDIAFALDSSWSPLARFMKAGGNGSKSNSRT